MDSAPLAEDGSGASGNTRVAEGAKGARSTVKPLKRACDCCRKRKVKCDGNDPCSPCQRAAIQCAYLQPVKKKGPKGLRSAKVLHALRRIDSSRADSPVSPLSLEQPSFGRWNWSSATAPNTNSNSVLPKHNQALSDIDLTFALHDPSIHRHSLNSQTTSGPELVAQHATPISPLGIASNARFDWPVGLDIRGVPDDLPTSLSTSHAPHGLQRAFANEAFIPYVQLFFEHMFVIMPIIDRKVFLDPEYYRREEMTDSEYCFLCALCAATIVQLDDSIAQPALLDHSKRPDDCFAEECSRVRQNIDYVEEDSTISIMTSFFLFAYHGNHERHAKAWYWLQESITMAENLNMDDERAYSRLPAVEAQWRRRLYWLLFITERAYAVQRRKHTRLHASVGLPGNFESEDPQMLNGFINLAHLFSAVDESFIRAWRGSRRASLCNEAWLSNVQKALDSTAQLECHGDSSETQRLDIAVTREWLHVLAWQMGVSNGLIWGEGEGGLRLDYPVELARRVVAITSGANALALDSHGIGMEQKLSDIAGCLADVLRCTGDMSETFFEGKEYLSLLLQRLSSMRGKESRYLKPLMARAEGLIGYELGLASLPLPDNNDELSAHGPSRGSIFPFQHPSPRWSMQESMSMLRTLSMSGGLGMSGLRIPLAEDFRQRRPSGRIVTEEEFNNLSSWVHGEVTQRC